MSPLPSDASARADPGPAARAPGPERRSCATSTARSLRWSSAPRTLAFPLPPARVLEALSDRFGLVACISGRRAEEARTDRRPRLAHLHRQPWARAPGAGRRDGPRSTRRVEPLGRPRAGVRSRAFRRPAARGRACGSRTRTRSGPFTGAGLRDPDAAPRRCSRRSPRQPGRPASSRTGGAWCSRSARRPTSTRAQRSTAALAGAQVQRRALRRRRHDRPRRLPPPARAPGRGSPGACGLRRGVLTGGARGDRRRGGPRRGRPRGVPRAARPAGGLTPAPLALHRLPQVDGDADGRRGDRAGGRHRRGAAAQDDTTTIIFALAWWTLAALIGDLARPPQRDHARDRPAARAGALHRHAAGDPARSP